MSWASNAGRNATNMASQIMQRHEASRKPQNVEQGTTISEVKNFHCIVSFLRASAVPCWIFCGSLRRSIRRLWLVILRAVHNLLPVLVIVELRAVLQVVTVLALVARTAIKRRVNLWILDV